MVFHGASGLFPLPLRSCHNLAMTSNSLLSRLLLEDMSMLDWTNRHTSKFFSSFFIDLFCIH